MDRLHQWGTLQNNTCCLCLQEPETINHLFFACPYSAATWSAILSKCSINHTPTDWSREQVWLTATLVGNQPTHTTKRLAFTSTVYHIWTERNRRIFQSESRPVQSTISAIITSVKQRLVFLFPQVQNNAANKSLFDSWEIHTHYKDVTHKWIKYPTLIPGYIGLSTDASLKTGLAGLGYILRDENSNVLLAGAAGVTPSNSILLHELQAIYKGLEVALHRNHTHIQVLSDSKVGIDIMNGIVEAPWTCWCIISQIKAARHKFQDVQFSFVHRQVNKPADHLSHICQCITDNDIQYGPEDLPQQLISLVNRDKTQAPVIRTQ